jgi:hypothetical protein
LKLLGEDVGVNGVPGDFGDHAQIDEPETHSTDVVVFDGVVQVVVGECRLACPEPDRALRISKCWRAIHLNYRARRCSCSREIHCGARFSTSMRMY